MPPLANNRFALCFAQCTQKIASPRHSQSRLSIFPCEPSAAWRSNPTGMEFGPIALRPHLAMGLPLSSCPAEILSGRAGSSNRTKVSMQSKTYDLSRRDAHARDLGIECITLVEPGIGKCHDLSGQLSWLWAKLVWKCCTIIRNGDCRGFEAMNRH